MKKILTSLFAIIICITLTTSALAEYKSAFLFNNYGGNFWFDSLEDRGMKTVDASEMGYSHMHVMGIKTGTACGIGGSVDYGGTGLNFYKANLIGNKVSGAVRVDIMIRNFEAGLTADDLMTQAAVYPGNTLFFVAKNESCGSECLHALYLDGAVIKGPQAEESTQKITIGDKVVELKAYAIKDEFGGLTNYVRIRDIALLLNGTKAQFEVSWDGAVNLVKGKAYTPNGDEMKVPFSGKQNYTLSANPTKIDGYEISKWNLSAIMLTDSNGGGYTYYKLRDLGQQLGFNVGWSEAKGVYIEPDKEYSWED